jgi:hypothetical protein
MTLKIQLDDDYGRGIDFAPGTVPATPVKGRLSVSCQDFPDENTIQGVYKQAIKLVARKLKKDGVITAAHNARMWRDPDYEKQVMMRRSMRGPKLC